MRSRSLSMVCSLPLLAALACDDGERPTAVGTLERDRLDLVAVASEPIVSQPVSEGDRVAAGSLLLQLDPRRSEATLAQASSTRDRMAASLAELERGPRRERIAEARARLQGAEGRLTTAKSDLARARQLHADGALAQGQLDQRRARFDEALAARDAARATLTELRKGARDEELAQAEAALAEADAALTDIQIRLERLSVHAPAAAVVQTLPYEVGEQPAAGAVVAVLLADGPPYARVYVPAALRLDVQAGTPAQIHVDGVSSPLAGRVRTVESDASFTPYYALTERDRGRLVYQAQVDLIADAAAAKLARRLPTGVPVEVTFGSAAGSSDGGHDRR